MIPEHKVTEIYFVVDEFFKEFDKTIKEHSLQESSKRKSDDDSDTVSCLFGKKSKSIL